MSQTNGDSITRTVEQRRRDFKKAVALAETTAREWAKANGKSETQLYRVLNGETSAPLVALIDAFIGEWLGLVPAKGLGGMVESVR